MKLVSKYPTGTTDFVGHLFVNGGDVRAMMFFISMLDTEMLFRALREMYQNNMGAKEFPWKLSRCLNDLDAKKKLLEELRHVMVDFLPEYKDKNKEDFFVELLSVLDDVKEELVRQNSLEGA
jgi:hypothetical protein